MQVTIEQAELESVTTEDDRYQIAIYTTEGERIGRGTFTGGTADSQVRPGVRRLWSYLNCPIPEGVERVEVEIETSRAMPVRAHMDFF